MRKPRRLSNVGESAILIVVVKVTCRGLVLRESFNRRTVWKINIWPAVIIVVKNKVSVAGRLNEEFFVSIAPVDVQGIETRLRSYILKLNLTRDNCGSVPPPSIGMLRRRSRCK